MSEPKENHPEKVIRPVEVLANDDPLLHYVVQHAKDVKDRRSSRMKVYNSSLTEEERKERRSRGGKATVAKYGKEWMKLIANKPRKKSVKRKISARKLALEAMKDGTRRAHMISMAKKGGKTTLERYGPDYFRSLRQLQLIRKKEKLEHESGTKD